MRKVYVIGVGTTKFTKPHPLNEDYPVLAKEATTKALNDCNITYFEIQEAIVGYVYGDSACGQRALYEVGMTGIPIINVNNNCATGGTALYLAREAISSGRRDCVLALGFEIMQKGGLTASFYSRSHPMEKYIAFMHKANGLAKAPIPVQMFGYVAEEHMKKYGTRPEHFAKIAWKNHKHSINNPNAQFQKEYDIGQILDSPKVFGVLTKLQCCPASDGAAAVILASEKYVCQRGLKDQAVEIMGMEMASDGPSTFVDNSYISLVGYDTTKRAADRLFINTNLQRSDVQVVELHDCFSSNEMITYEALGLCEPGKGGEMVDRGDNTYGGKYVINPSGGLMSKGHPLGATGLAQCAELCWQLRGGAGKRQVEGATVGLQHNYGLGGAVVVGLYSLGFPPAYNTCDANRSKL